MQNINFYLEEYHPKPLSFDSRFAAIVSVISLLGVLLIGWVQADQVNSLQLSLKARKEHSVHLKQQIVTIQKQLAKSPEINSLQSQLISSQNELNRYRKVMSLVKSPIADEPISYSKILEDLSLQQSDSLWLTKIDIRKRNLSLHGTTTKTTSIPFYIDELKRTHSLRRYFDELKIERDQNNKQLINFQLLNGRLINEE